MRSFAIATAFGLAAASPARVSDYIRAAGNTPSGTTPFGSNGTTNGTTSQEPCAIVSQQWAASPDSIVEVDAYTAYQCLQSVPLHVEKGILQLEGIKTFVQFQSTLAYLKEPTDGYLYPAVDIEGDLDKIIDNLKAGAYATEYDLQREIHSLISSAYDGHFSYTPDMFAVFRFSVPAPLYSISKDGLSLPEIYYGNDTLYLSGNSTRNATISPVARINDMDVETYLNELGLSLNYQDPDASYNALFPTGLKVTAGIKGSQFSSRATYPGPKTTFTYRNGTTQTIETLAKTSANLTEVYDGKSFYKVFCTENGQEAAYNASLEAPQTPTSSAPLTIPTTEVPFRPVPANLTAKYGKIATFPPVVVANDDGVIAGFFPDENPDLAVLIISAFGSSPEYNVGFANTVRMFLASAKAAGKTKLAIDMRGNPGGNVPLAYDLFGQLFPKIVPYGATNFRATQLLNDTGYIISDYYSNVTNVTISPKEGCNSDFNSHPFNFREQLDQNDQPFTSWSDYYGPDMHNEGNFTSLSRYNLADRYSLFCEQTSNYGNLTGITPQVFDAENIVLIQDGGCGSTCTVFTEFMKSQAKVKQITFGGRKQTGPMQGVGGVKGANIYSFQVFSGVISNVEETYADEESEYKPYMAKYKNLTGPATQALLRAAADPEQGYPAKAASVNVRNNIRYGDETATPLQFVYEAADCRLFYTADMVFSQSAVWNAAYAARWGNGTCVAGSTGHPSSAPDSDAIYPAPESARNLFGATISSVIPADLNATTSSPAGSQETTAAVSSSAPSATGTLQPYTGAASNTLPGGSTFAAVSMLLGLLVLV